MHPARNVTLSRKTHRHQKIINTGNGNKSVTKIIYLTTSRGVQVTYPVVPMTETQKQHPEWGLCGGSQTGYQTMFVFECDCQQTSMENTDVLIGIYQGPWNTALEGGGISDYTNNCQYTYHFKTIHACPISFCPESLSPVSSPKNAMTDTDKLMIICFSLILSYLMIACGYTVIKFGQLGIPTKHFKTCGSICSKLLCIKQDKTDNYSEFTGSSVSYGAADKNASLHNSL